MPSKEIWECLITWILLRPGVKCRLVVKTEGFTTTIVVRNSTCLNLLFSEYYTSPSSGWHTKNVRSYSYQLKGLFLYWIVLCVQPFCLMGQIDGARSVHRPDWVYGSNSSAWGQHSWGPISLHITSATEANLSMCCLEILQWGSGGCANCDHSPAAKFLDREEPCGPDNIVLWARSSPQARGEHSRDSL